MIIFLTGKDDVVEPFPPASWENETNFVITKSMSQMYGWIIFAGCFAVASLVAAAFIYGKKMIFGTRYSEIPQNSEGSVCGQIRIRTRYNVRYVVCTHTHTHTHTHI